MSFSGARRPCTPRTRGWSSGSATIIAAKKASGGQRASASTPRGSTEGVPGLPLRRSASHGATGGSKRTQAKTSTSRHSPREPTIETNGLYNVPQKAASRVRLDSCSSMSNIRRNGASNEITDVNIKVCVRIRPLSAIENRNGESNVTLCEGDCGGSLQMMNPSGSSEEGVDASQGLFSFDWVLSEACSQTKVYELLGQRVVLAVADGFHGCIFAHGQTGSGKSHTIFGSQEEEGLLPRICDGLFNELVEGQAEYIVRLSYLEIYNERLRDLLVPAVDNMQDLHVRKHPKFGVFVEGLTLNVVQAADDVKRLLDFGHKIRVVGRTNMNAASSRSHAVVTLHVALRFPREVPDDSGVPVGGTIRRHAQLHVIDLAGSERMKQVGIQKRSETTSETKEINKSLWALSLMISSLAEQQRSNSSSSYVPYRNSKLTHILSDSLMGNCRTAMVACISPAASAFGVSISTLRFAASAKKIRTRPVKNEELEGTLISNLKAEIESLRQQLSKVNSDQESFNNIRDRLATTQFLEEEFHASSSWAEKKAQAVHFDTAREMTLERLGLSNDSITEACRRGNGSVFSLMHTDADPYLVNVCDDPLLSGCLTYVLPKGEVVSVGSDPMCKIQIEGLGVQPEMCQIVNEDGETVQVHVLSSVGESVSTRSTRSTNWSHLEGTSSARLTQRRGSLYKTGVSQVFINHDLIMKTAQIRSGDRLRIGRTHVFQLFIPQESDAAKSLASLCKSSSLYEQVLFEEYANHLKERLGQARAEDVFSRLQDLQHLVDEANEITAELRGGDNREFEFKAHILTDVSSADKDPCLAVVLQQSEKPIDVTSSSEPIYSSFQEDVITVWSEQKFRQRLEVMRDLHTEIECRDLPWGVASDLDPWRDDLGVHPVGVPSRQGQHSPVSGSRPSASEPDAEPRGPLCDERLSIMQADLQSTRARLAEAQAQLQQLSSQSKASRASAEEAQSKLSTLEKELRRLAAERSNEAHQDTTAQSGSPKKIVHLATTYGLPSRQTDESISPPTLAGSRNDSPSIGPSRSSRSPAQVLGGSFEVRTVSRSLSPRIHHLAPTLSSSRSSLPERQPSLGTYSLTATTVSSNGFTDAKLGQAAPHSARIAEAWPQKLVVGPTRDASSPLSARRIASPSHRVVASHKAVSPASFSMPDQCKYQQVSARVITPRRSLTPTRFVRAQTSPTLSTAPTQARRQLQNELTNMRQELQSLELLCQSPELERPSKIQQVSFGRDASLD